MVPSRSTTLPGAACGFRSRSGSCCGGLGARREAAKWLFGSGTGVRGVWLSLLSVRAEVGAWLRSSSLRRSYLKRSCLGGRRKGEQSPSDPALQPLHACPWVGRISLSSSSFLALVLVTGCRMNCRSEVLEVSVEGRQVEEAMLAVLHTVLLHRSTGKFHYKKEGTYSIGTVGTQDVDCDFIDFTYVRVSSEELDRALRKVVGEFKDALRNSGGDGLGQISLEFYQKKKSRWPFSDECIPWEVWTVKVHVVALATEQERQICREKVGEKLCEKIINIVEVMNRHEYLPKMPTQSEVDNVFDTGLRDVQPYLYKISFQITDALGTSVTTTMRRLIKDTLAL
ncbi:autophagy-related protein 101 isoform X1 [Castor canadensis]|uniref:Autophagy-related protein 101 n=3 Tax=Castor canadensis TaxID=51338 RepID=A0A8B7WFY0_CASCN|nr:autophagy-related protein 101 isoform X1 [Castor canadensis]